jgi:hypothetical protein
VLTGDIPTTLATAGRIAAGVPIALAAVPAVLNLRHSLKPEFGTPELALRLRAWSAVLQVLAGLLIILTAIVEIWLDLDTAGQWLFAVYGAAAAIAVLGQVAFYLSRVAEKPPTAPKPPKDAKPPKPPKPPKEKKEKRRARKGGGKMTETIAAEEAAPAPDEVSGETALISAATAPDTTAPDTVVTEVETGVLEADAGIPDTEVADTEVADTEVPETEATAPADAEAAPAGGLRNKRPVGKSRHRLPR